jgi:hypothetical protein
LVDIKKVIRILDTVINYVPFEIFGGPIIDEEQISYLDSNFDIKYGDAKLTFIV